MRIVDFIASDLLFQAEYRKNSQVFLVTYSKEIAKKVIFSIHNQIKKLKNFKIIKTILDKIKIIISNNLEECIKISNLYAPEYVII